MTPVYSPITLADGWVGRVLTTIGDASPSNASPFAASTLDAWREWLSVLVSDPYALPESKALKHSLSVEVLRAHGPPAVSLLGRNSAVVCKRNTICGLTNRVASTFRRSRARRSFDRAQLLLNAHIGTALPLAVVERSRSPRASWFVCEYLDNVVDLDSLVLTRISRIPSPKARAAKSTVINATADFFARLYRARLHHRDLKASNILLSDWDSEAGNRTRALVVDLDGLAERWPMRVGIRWQPLYRLAASLIDYPLITRTDHARFLREYHLQCGDHSDEWRVRFRKLSNRAARYARRSRHRKSGKLDG